MYRKYQNLELHIVRWHGLWSIGYSWCSGYRVYSSPVPTFVCTINPPVLALVFYYTPSKLHSQTHFATYYSTCHLAPATWHLAPAPRLLYLGSELVRVTRKQPRGPRARRRTTCGARTPTRPTRRVAAAAGLGVRVVVAVPPLSELGRRSTGW